MLNFWQRAIFTLPLITRGCGRSRTISSPVRLLLKAIRLRPPPHVGLQRREAHLQVQVHQTLAPHFDSEVFTVDLTGEEIVLDLPQPLVINGDVKIALCQKFNMDPLKLGSRPTLTSHGPHAKLCHFWVNTCFLALGHSCPLTHTVVDRRGRASSLITIPTTNRFSPLEGALRGCGCDWTDRHGRQGRIGPVPGARGTLRWSWSWRKRVGGGALGGEGQIAGQMWVRGQEWPSARKQVFTQMWQSFSWGLWEVRVGFAAAVSARGRRGNTCSDRQRRTGSAGYRARSPGRHGRG